MRTPAYARAIVNSGLAIEHRVGQVTERGDVESRSHVGAAAVHGISADVGIPEAPTARDSTTGASPRSAIAFLNMRAGRTTAMYWSAVTMFVASTQIPPR